MRTFESRTAFSKETPAQHVVLKIFSGIDHRFAYVGVGSEVHDGVNALQERRQFGCVRNVSHNQLEALRKRGVAGYSDCRK